MSAKKRTNPLKRTAKIKPKPKPRKPSVTNAEWLRDGTPGLGAQIPCMDWPADSLPSGTIPPITEPYPWPVRVLNWIDDTQYALRRRLANALYGLAERVAP